MNDTNLSELLKAIRAYGTHDGSVYDFGAVMQMLEACLDNLRAHALEAEIDDMPDYLNEDQKSFLRKLADACPRDTETS
ncbi:MAG: hypothetical protein V4773_07385 [Verrucomicrobiota bacterium]